MRVEEAIVIFRTMHPRDVLPDSLAKQIREIYEEEEITVIHCDSVGKNCYPIKVKRKDRYDIQEED